MSQIQQTLGEILRRLQVAEGRRLTYRDLAQLAGTSERTIAEWMRGATSPMAMNGLMNLMAALKPDDAMEVLDHWRKTTPQEQTSKDNGQGNQK